jgi:hypothetical protein
VLVGGLFFVVGNLDGEHCGSVLDDVFLSHSSKPAMLTEVFFQDTNESSHSMTPRASSPPPLLFHWWLNWSCDTSLQHTYATNQRISVCSLLYDDISSILHATFVIRAQFPECIIISIVVPIALMPIINFLTVRSFWDWHNSWLGSTSFSLSCRIEKKRLLT